MIVTAPAHRALPLCWTLCQVQVVTAPSEMASTPCPFYGRRIRHREEVKPLTQCHPGRAWASALAIWGHGFHCYASCLGGPRPVPGPPPLPTPWAPGEGPSRRPCGSRGPPWSWGCERQGWERRPGSWPEPAPPVWPLEDACPLPVVPAGWDRGEGSFCRVIPSGAESR